MTQANQYKIGIVGLGKMGASIAQGIVTSGKGQVFGFDPFSNPKLYGVLMKTNIPALEESCDVIILAVKPGDITKVLSEFKTPKSFLSIAAGIPLAVLKESAPFGSKVSRLMPNLPLVIGRGAVGFHGDLELEQVVFDLFGGLGVVVKIGKESLLDVVTGLSGSGPAYVLTFLHALTEAGLKEGLAYDESLTLALETIGGTVEYFRKLKAENPEIHPMEVRNWVTSPGGTTIYGLEALERGGFSVSVKDAVAAATFRSQELGKKG